MPLTTEHREQYRRWLLDRDLHPDAVATIIEDMPPFAWSEIARRSDLAELEGRLDTRLDGMDKRLDGVEDGLVNVGKRLDTLYQAVMYQGVGLIITLLLGFSAVFTAILLSI